MLLAWDIMDWKIKFLQSVIKILIIFKKVGFEHVPLKRYSTNKMVKTNSMNIIFFIIYKFSLKGNEPRPGVFAAKYRLQMHSSENFWPKTIKFDGYRMLGYEFICDCKIKSLQSLIEIFSLASNNWGFEQVPLKRYWRKKMIKMY